MAVTVISGDLLDGIGASQAGQVLPADRNCKALGAI
jgi:hypothetical protein